MITEVDQQELEWNWIDAERKGLGLSLPPWLAKLDIDNGDNKYRRGSSFDFGGGE